MRNTGLLTAGLSLTLLLQTAPTVSAESTAAEELARELRQSDDRVMQRFGDRWYDMIRLQNWTSATGQHTVIAKYVSHDDETKTVTLRAVKGSGDSREEKEITVPRAKLNTECQSRVRRISRLHPKLLERLAEAAAAAEEEAVDTGNEGFGEEFVGREGREFDIPATRRPPPRQARDPRNEDPRAAASARRAADETDEFQDEYDAALENPYAGSRFLTRDQLVEDRQFESRDPRASRVPRQAQASRVVSRSQVSSTSDYVTLVPYEPAEFAAAKDASWQEFREPFGEGSTLHARLVPAPPIAGQPAKLQVTVVNEGVYGRLQPRISARLGPPTDDTGVIKDDSGADWVELEVVGDMNLDQSTRETAQLDATSEHQNPGQPRESHYQIGLLLPPGESAIQFKLDHGNGQESPVALHGFNVIAAPTALAPTTLIDAIR